jgi:hypothetical protein
VPNKKEKIIEPIDASLEDVANSLVCPAPPKTNKNKMIEYAFEEIPAPPSQLILDLTVQVQRDVNGIEMGVLENGISFLTQVGLAKISGVSRSVIYDISQEWEKHFDDQTIGKDRISFLKQYLFENGYSERKLYIETRKDGSVHYAYPDIVCMAIMEFYSFEVKTQNKIALQNYRKLAVHGLQSFIYDALGYAPGDKWKYHTDRVSLLKDSSPDGYFIVFNEISGLIVDLITANLTVNDKTIPDISVGLAWAKYWESAKLGLKYGDRIKYEHNYPEYYPQATSNPQKPWAYPDNSLPEFRQWFRKHYLLTKFPKYILTKANVISGGALEASRIANLFKPKEITG